MALEGRWADQSMTAPAHKPPSEATDQREPPSLRKLVEDYGGYNKITPEAWAEFDAAMALWKEFVRGGGLHRR